MPETPDVDGSDFLEASAALRTAAVVSCNLSPSSIDIFMYLANYLFSYYVNAI